MPSTERPVHADLDLERVRSRVSAYVYGNVLVLAAVVGCAPESVRSGRAVVIVLATMVTTYLAHVVAHRIGESVGRRQEEARLHLRAELRDALPIVTSGVLPALVLLVASLVGSEGTAGAVAQLVAALVPVVRLAGTGSVTARMAAGGPSRSAFWSAVGLAVAGSLIAVVKVLLTH
ncbi:hypothetical protein FHN55_00935 [Streptomyces sp. NP160]|uniref:hypothetical protein n=1 Tax=Streptomyces sp. NP160 TaxID=2586637 RepID=UPI00111B08BB|nr:hypothetical protein [Streptomyces sp. NP160]TNM70279.1 hypothetical protein FHN55_00935 [Streptomyces sp. NP160]